MKMNLKNGFIIIVTITLIVSITYLIQNTNSNNPKTKFEEKRDEIVSEIFYTIDRAEELGGIYKCCIDPPCTMCFLGNWIWDDGTCDCDGMIVKEEWDKVCPQCKRGIEEGRCISQINDSSCIVSESD